MVSVSAVERFCSASGLSHHLAELATWKLWNRLGLEITSSGKDGNATAGIVDPTAPEDRSPNEFPAS
jgi:hypothetical protein